MAMATPSSWKSKTSWTSGLPPSGLKVMVSLPLPLCGNPPPCTDRRGRGGRCRWARSSPRRGGGRFADNGFPEDGAPRMFLMVPLGERHIFLSPNSSTRPSSGVMVAHLMPTPHFLMAWAASTVTRSSVLSRFSTPRSKYSMVRSR